MSKTTASSSRWSSDTLTSPAPIRQSRQLSATRGVLRQPPGADRRTRQCSEAAHPPPADRRRSPPSPSSRPVPSSSRRTAVGRGARRYRWWEVCPLPAFACGTARSAQPKLPFLRHPPSGPCTGRHPPRPSRAAVAACLRPAHSTPPCTRGRFRSCLPCGSPSVSAVAT